MQLFAGAITRPYPYKEKYLDKQIILLIPIHRDAFIANSTNVQPNENYVNGIGLYLEEYVETLKKINRYWSVLVIIYIH